MESRVSQVGKNSFCSTEHQLAHWIHEFISRVSITDRNASPFFCRLRITVSREWRMEGNLATTLRDLRTYQSAVTFSFAVLSQRACHICVEDREPEYRAPFEVRETRINGFRDALRLCRQLYTDVYVYTNTHTHNEWPSRRNSMTATRCSMHQRREP